MGMFVGIVDIQIDVMIQLTCKILSQFDVMLASQLAGIHFILKDIILGFLSINQ